MAKDGKQVSSMIAEALRGVSKKESKARQEGQALFGYLMAN
jgi:hypothetical protein